MTGEKNWVHGKQAWIAAILSSIVATSGVVYQLVTTQTSKQIRPGAAQGKPASAFASDGVTAGGWTALESMKQGAAFAATVALPDGHIFVISGRTNDNGKRKVTHAVRVYDPRQNIWSEASSIPTPRTEPGVALGQDGKIYVIGGADTQRRQNVVEAYDPKTDMWARCKPMPTPREALWAVAAKGADGRVRIYAIGGRDRSKPGNGLSAVEAYDPTTDTWIAMAPMPTPRHALTATLGPDGQIYALGGSNDGVFCTDVVDIYDPMKNVWTMGPPLPYGRECAAAVFTPGQEGEVLVFGGWDRRSWPLADVVAYSPRTRKWRALPPMPTARAAVGAVTRTGADGYFHITVLGGVYGETAVEEYSFRPVATHR